MSLCCINILMHWLELQKITYCWFKYIVLWWNLHTFTSEIVNAEVVFTTNTIYQHFFYSCFNMKNCLSFKTDECFINTYSETSDDTPRCHNWSADWRIDSRQSLFICHWPSHFFSSFLATAERDAADGEPAFRHHQRRLGDGRGATWPDRRKRQGEQNFFLKQSPLNHRDLSFFFSGMTGPQAAKVHPSSLSSLIFPQVGAQSCARQLRFVITVTL